MSQILSDILQEHKKQQDKFPLKNCGVEVTANVYAEVLKSSKTKVADLISLKLA